MSRQKLHTFDFLAQTAVQLPSTVVLVGSDHFLIDQALRHTEGFLSGGDPEALPPQKFYGKELKWSELAAELATSSLFSPGHSQPVLLMEAAPFISKYRAELEHWVAAPTSNNTLILVTDTWLATTKLYKLVQQHGLQIQCEPPTAGERGKSVDFKRITHWINQRAQQQHQLKLSHEVALLLWEFSQDSFGMVDTSLAKLSLLLPPGSSVTMEQIRQYVGGWKAESVWQAVDQALDGQPEKAIDTLHPIFHAGEHPLSVMGQLSWALRRYAIAYDLYNQSRLEHGRADMPQALAAAGFRDWGAEKEKAAMRLRRLGRRRLDLLHRWLLDIDLALKNTHSAETSGRALIERLLIQMGQAGPPS
jgi:DNA polymerase III subunit delta